MKIVYVEWVDSCTTLGWRNPEKDETSLIRSVGLLISKTEKTITLSTSQSQTGRVLDQLHIPRSVVKKYKVLEEIPE